MLRPGIGSVIRYGYLWADQADRGIEEGLKDRPCAVVITVLDDDGRYALHVMPITHLQPKTGDLAIELSQATKRRLGLDEERSWIVTNEYNSFDWPGPDIRPDASGEIILGALPFGVVERAVECLRTHAIAGNVRRAIRT